MVRARYLHTIEVDSCTSVVAGVTWVLLVDLFFVINEEEGEKINKFCLHNKNLSIITWWFVLFETSASLFPTSMWLLSSRGCGHVLPMARAMSDNVTWSLQCELWKFKMLERPNVTFNGLVLLCSASRDYIPWNFGDLYLIRNAYSDGKTWMHWGLENLHMLHVYFLSSCATRWNAQGLQLLYTH